MAFNREQPRIPAKIGTVMLRLRTVPQPTQEDPNARLRRYDAMIQVLDENDQEIKTVAIDLLRGNNGNPHVNEDQKGRLDTMVDFFLNRAISEILPETQR